MRIVRRKPVAFIYWPNGNRNVSSGINGKIKCPLFGEESLDREEKIKRKT